MKTLCTVLVVFWFGIISNQTASSQWMRTNGPTGAIVTSLTTSGPNVLALAYGAGAFISTDKGTSWTDINSAFSNSDVSVFASIDNQVIAMGITSTGPNVFRSTDNGASFTKVANDLPAVGAFFCALISGSTTLCYTDVGMFSSGDNGSTWTKTGNGLPSYPIKSLIISPDGKGKLLAGTIGGGVFISTDNGLNWAPINQGLTSTYANVLTVAGQSIFVGTSKGIFVTNNSGTDWTLSNLGIIGSTVEVLLTDPDGSGTLYAGVAFNGVFRSDDKGAHWSPINTGLTEGVYSLCKIADVLLAGTYNVGLFQSLNKGTSWTVSNIGLIGNDVIGMATDGINIYAGMADKASGGGVFGTSDKGTSWTLLDNGFTSSRVIALASSGTNLYAGIEGAGGVLISTNAGKNWTNTNAITSGGVYSLAVDGSNIYAGTGFNGLLLSQDNGVKWKRVGIGSLGGSYCTALALSGSNLFAASWQGGVYLSVDSGSTWKQKNNGLNEFNIYSLAVKGSTLFVGTVSGIYRSVNSGNNWTKVDTTLTYSLMISGSNIFAGSKYGVQLSTDNGITWKSISANLPPGTAVSAMLVKDGFLFAGIHGVWKRPLSDVVSVPVDNDLSEDRGLIRNYPNPFSTHTDIEFMVCTYEPISIDIRDLNGTIVRHLVLNTLFSGGAHHVEWNGLNDTGAMLPKGIYLALLQTSRQITVSKLSLIE